MEEARQAEATGLEIAVIGMAGRFPGARDLAEFWRNLAGGVESISSFSEEELLAAGEDPVLVRDPRYIRARGVLAEADLFDAGFFGYSPREAEVIDPQQRIFLEYAWRALEDAGYDPRRYEGVVGVYGGVSTNTYIRNLLARPDILAQVGRMQLSLANERDFLCTRVAYKLSLEGPSVDVQTACSTSLVATHLACQALLGGECDMALAGGVSIVFPQESGYLYQEDGVFSPDGHCRAFDEWAQGTVGGNGVGIVVLKRLADALRDGDAVRAVIRGSAINNDGSHKAGFTAPGIDGQAKVIATAQEIARVEPETITYFEAHGSGTPLGDPIEIASATQAFRIGTDRRGFCAIGSVKTNIGHLDAAAGIAGLIKTVLAVQHGTLPPSLHFERPNPQIDFAASPFYVSTKAAAWPAGLVPRRAGVSSFGIGGTNAHVVLEESPPVEPGTPGRPWLLLPLSARTETALAAATRAIADHLCEHPGLPPADVAYTLQVGRRRFEHRRVVIARDGEDLIRLLDGGVPGRMLTAVRDPGPPPPIAFLLSGLGDHYPGMGLGLYRMEPVFREEVDRCARLLAPELGLDLRYLLYPGLLNGAGVPGDADASSARSAAGLDLRSMLRGRNSSTDEEGRSLDATAVIQPALFVLEYALAQLWAAWGIHPQAMLGYSLGEYVAACLSGVLSLEDALTLVARRARMIQRLPGGAMLAVPLAERDIEPHLGASLSLAAVNGRALCVVSGAVEAVAGLERHLRSQGLACRWLEARHAFHSALMEPVADSFRELVHSVALAAPRIPYLSNVTGTWITAAEATDPEYWVRHLCGTVRFADGLSELWREPGRILLEVGPGQTLGSLALQQAPEAGAERIVLASLRHGYDRQADEEVPLKTLGRLWLAGVEVDWSGFHAGERRRRVPLPAYPFERRRFWIEGRSASAAVRRPAEAKIPDIADWFHVPAWRSAPRPPSGPSKPPRRWLVLLDEHGVGHELARRLEAAGHEVVAVRAGDDPGAGSQLAAPGDPPERILHLWSLGPGDAADPARFAREQTLGFYSLLSLVQALGQAARNRPVEICVVVDGVLSVERGDLLRPERATLLGALQVIPQEHPAIRCRLIDVDLRELGDGLVERLLAELAVQDPEPAVARRGERRWVPGFAPVRLGPAESPLREGGVYLITGGLGGIGLGLAELLARKVRAKLVLTGRSEVPERSLWPQLLAAGGAWSDKVRRLQALEESGAEVLALCADVTDEEQMRSAVARCLGRFGGLHGVLHAAGLPGAGLIQAKTREMADRVQAPKTAGTVVLGRVLEGLQLDFLALFSSVTSTFGGVGQVDYTAASAFLDAFAEGHAARGDRRTVAIDWCEWQWDAWTGSVQLVDPEIRRQLDRQRQLFGLTFEEGLEALCRALASGLPRVAVLTRDFASYQRHSISDVLSGLEALRHKSEASRMHSRPALGTPYVAPRTELEQALVAIWQELLGLQPVGIEDNFLEMGGHSLLALQVIARIHESLGADLPLHVLLESATVAELAEMVAGRQQVAAPPSGNGGTTGLGAREVLGRLDELSDEQVDGLLAEILAEQDGERV